ncbi:MAG: hypothetical protein ACP5JW_01870 [Candidatus Bathyarchaeia archaeon]
MAVDNIRFGMVRRELREIADYVSNTIANLYFLVNSTEIQSVNLTKELVYLPSSVENFVYVLRIEGSGGTALKVIAYLKDRSSVLADTWLTPGLKVDAARNSVVSCGWTVVVGCYRNSAGVYVWIGYG